MRPLASLQQLVWVGGAHDRILQTEKPRPELSQARGAEPERAAPGSFLGRVPGGSLGKGREGTGLGDKPFHQPYPALHLQRPLVGA